MSMFTGNLLLDLMSIVAGLLAVLFAYTQWIYRTWERNNVPYFKPKFPYGNRQPLDKTAVGEDIFNLSNTAKENGWKYFGMFLALNPYFVPLDLEMIKCIMVKDFKYFTERGFYYNEKHDPLTANLFTLGGEKWKRVRTILRPTFTSGKLRGMFQILNSCSEQLENALKEFNTEEPIDIKKIMCCFTTDVICSCAFGIECNSFKEPDAPFMRYGTRLFDRNLFERIKELFGHSFPKLAVALRVKLVPADVRYFFYDAILKTVSYREMNNYSRKDFLQTLIDIGKSKTPEEIATRNPNERSFTMDEIVAQCFVFFLGGFETSATTVTFALYELSLHPEIQEKVREELFEVLDKYENKITYDSLNDLPYMQQVIDEVLRKYPPAPIINRRCVQDYKVPGTDLVLKKGTNVIIPIQHVHYDETFYKDANKFDPDRFNHEEKLKRPSFAYFPFGEGPRICIGMRFGLMETKIAMATILRNFRVKLNPRTETPLQIDPISFVTTIKGGLWLDLEKLYT